MQCMLGSGSSKYFHLYAHYEGVSYPVPVKRQCTYMFPSQLFSFLSLMFADLLQCRPVHTPSKKTIILAIIFVSAARSYWFILLLATVSNIQPFMFCILIHISQPKDMHSDYYICSLFLNFCRLLEEHSTSSQEVTTLLVRQRCMTWKWIQDRNIF